MIELKLTKEQLQALVGLLDAGVRSTGLQAVGAASELLQLITKATEENNG
jgi:hypothetical protein